jgi:hypothetical protein
MGIMRSLSGVVLSKVQPPEGPTAEIVHQAMRHAIDGLGPLRSAREAAEKALATADGDVESAIDRLIRTHVVLSGAEGFVTNLGGLVTATWSIPANIAGLALVQIRLAASIAHLRGYDLADPRVRNAVLVVLLGRNAVRGMKRAGKLPGTPREIASLSEQSVRPDPGAKGAARSKLDRTVGAQVAATLLGEVGGKRAVGFVGRRIPVLGGVIGGSADAWNTRGVGAYARKELTPVAPAAAA